MSTLLTSASTELLGRPRSEHFMFSVARDSLVGAVRVLILKIVEWCRSAHTVSFREKRARLIDGFKCQEMLSGSDRATIEGKRD